MSSNEINFNKIKVKQEKIIPTASPSSQHEASSATTTTTKPSTSTKCSDECAETTSIKNINFSVDNNNTKEDFDIPPRNIFNVDNDEKKPIEQLKSSNEILVELFKAFNATPPAPNELAADDAECDSTITSTSKGNKVKLKKKIKKEKRVHKKKSSKKRRHNNSDNSSSNSDDSDDSYQRRRSTDDSDLRKHLKKLKRNKELRIDSENIEIGKETGGAEPATSKTSTDSTDKGINGSSITKTNRIIIKSLKNSKIYEENVEAHKKESNRKSERSRNVDDINMSRESSRSKHSSGRHDKEGSSSSATKHKHTDRGKDREDRDHKSDRHRAKDKNEKEKVSDRDKDRSRYSDKSHRERNRDYDDRDRDIRSRNTYYQHDSRHRSHSRSRYSSSRYSRRSRSRSRQRSEDRIDKKQLLEIARKNAISMLKCGTLPGTQNMSQEAKEKVLAKMRCGGQTVDELTQFCKKLSNGESNAYLSSVSDDSDHDKEGNQRAFNHPFVIKDRGPIVMNIKNSTPIPPKSADQAKTILMQYPVSSGQHHRLNESEWIPVEPPPPPPPPPPAATPPQQKMARKRVDKFREFSSEYHSPTNNPTITPLPPPPQLPVQLAECFDDSNNEFNYNSNIHNNNNTADYIYNNSNDNYNSSDTIFPSAGTSENLDVTTIISQRLNAMRKLQENPLDMVALKSLHNAQKQMTNWASSKHVPGQFTGSTGANILSAKELTSGYQAWARKDQMITTTPVTGGMGMHLLQKMGWRPGEGLGKDKTGSLQPLLLQVKLDKKGLVAIEEDPSQKRRKSQNIGQVKQNMESKHPVSLLGEVSAKRKWEPPFYEVVHETGPQHNRTFLFKVTMNGHVFQPPVSSSNKKEAKALTAKFALEQMGVL